MATLDPRYDPRAECALHGHELSNSRGCCRVCGASRDDVLRELGYVLEGDRWKRSEPGPHYALTWVS